VTDHPPDHFWFRKYLKFHCDDCGCDVGFRSRRRSFSERYVLPIFLLQPVRCSECFRRDYRLIFMPVRERLSEVTGKPPVPVVRNRDTRNVA
jgi:hypothetical protein